MDTKKKPGFLLLLVLGCCTVLICLAHVCFPSHGTETGHTETTGNSGWIRQISPHDLKKDSDGYYRLQLTVPPFDQMTLYWTSKEAPVFSVRTMDPDTNSWNEWQPIRESGQTYLQRIGGLFDFNLLQTDTSELTLELRAEKNAEAGLNDIRLEFSKEKKDTSSTLVMIVVMLAAGGVLYIKKRKAEAAGHH